MAASGNGQVVAADEDYHLTPVQHFFNLSALHVGGYLLGLFIGRWRIPIILFTRMQRVI
jgi:hypothetical protein